MSARIVVSEGDEISTVLMEIAREAAAAPDEDDRTLAQKAIRRLRVADLRELAMREVENWIDHFRRGEARAAERRAQEAAREAEQQQRQADLALVGQQRRQAAIQELLPTIAADPALVDPNRRPSHYLDAEERERLRDLLGAGYDAWYRRGCDLSEAHRLKHGQRGVATFESSYHPGGIDGYHLERARARTEQFIEMVAAEVRIEVTAELLATRFALGDGTRVTWGEATIDQHRQRIDMLTSIASGTVETAARHHAAISMIESASAGCLADLTDETLQEAA